MPHLISTKATTSTVVTISASDSADASLSLGLVSAEVALSTPIAATTALASTPAALTGVSTNGAGEGGSGVPTGVPNGPPKPGAASLVSARDAWVLMATAGLGLMAGIAMIGL